MAPASLFAHICHVVTQELFGVVIIEQGQLTACVCTAGGPTQQRGVFNWRRTGDVPHFGKCIFKTCYSLIEIVRRGVVVGLRFILVTGNQRTN
jgi:hypothetical protein